MTNDYIPDVARIREIYDDALASLMTASMPIEIHINRKELAGLTPSIIAKNIQTLDDDIVIYIFAIESGKSPSNYLANLHTGSRCVENATVIKHHELPTLLEKSYKITLRR